MINYDVIGRVAPPCVSDAAHHILADMGSNQGFLIWLASQSCMRKQYFLRRRSSGSFSWTLTRPWARLPVYAAMQAGRPKRVGQTWYARTSPYVCEHETNSIFIYSYHSDSMITSIYYYLESVTVYVIFNIMFSMVPLLSLYHLVLILSPKIRSNTNISKRRSALTLIGYIKQINKNVIGKLAGGLANCAELTFYPNPRTSLGAWA